eukprot:Rmarinus@m.10406
MLKYKLMFLRASGTLLLMIPMLYLGFFSIFSSNTAAYVQPAKKASDDNKVSIANAGAIPPLVKLLKESNNAEVQTYVSACLWNLAVNDTYAVSRLFSIFSSNTAAYVQAAKKASDDNKVSIANAGAIPPLVKLLKESNNAKVQTQVAACLENLAKNNDVKSQIESEKAKYK